jgi:DNA ligase-1
MNLHDIAVTSRSVASTSARKEKIGLLAELLRGLAPDEIAVAVAFLAGELW